MAGKAIAWGQLKDQYRAALPSYRDQPLVVDTDGKQPVASATWCC
jgi:hypothetical protein